MIVKTHSNGASSSIGKISIKQHSYSSLAGKVDWAEHFLAYCRDHQAPLDFFSWHVYARTPEPIAAKCVRMRKLLDDNGFKETESILNEWNYVKGWTDDWVYSRRVESTELNLKSAAFTAATMTLCQSAPLDMLMYYDARPRGMDGLFDAVTLWPMKGYYPFYAWSKMAKLGRQVRVSASNANALFATAARGADGRIGILLCRYTYDNNVVAAEDYVIRRADGKPFGEAIGHLTDFARTYTEIPVERAKDGALRIQLYPDSFVFIEIEK